MIKRAFPAILGLLSLCFPLVAQEIKNPVALIEEEVITPEELRITGEVDTAPALTLYRPNVFGTVDGSALIHGLPALTLLDGRRLPISSELGRMGRSPLNLFPIAFLSAVEAQKVVAPPVYGSDATGGVVNMRLNRIHTGGEVGFSYGRSDGKYGREDFQSYIIGSVGNDKVQITVGASYQESSGHFPRRGR